jgi:hypothetical protein
MDNGSLDLGEIEGRARAIIGGADEFRRKFPDGMDLGCEQCGKPFTPRTGSGGKPQRFCSPECRMAFHAENKPQRSQRGPTCDDAANLPSVIARPAPESARAPTPEDSDFDWRTDDSVILRQQPATAIYYNREGSLVIRQEREWDRYEDTYIFIAPQNIDSFLEKLCDMAGIPSAGR